jgi:hypothetical protein
MKRIYIVLCILSVLFENGYAQKRQSLPYLKVSPNGHFLMTEKGDPFFWLGDTGWLLAQRLNHEDAQKYLDDRAAKGFNVIQMMVLHDVRDCNFYGDSALVQGNIVAPYMTNGKTFSDFIQYDYWDNVEWLVDEAAKRKMYVALVPIWGSVIKKIEPSKAMVRVYMNLLMRKLQDRTNIVWLNGGDIEGDQFKEVFDEIGNTIKEHNPKQLVSFHPKGRCQSSTWFQDAAWLDFNMFQSGHKDYVQDSNGFGEDNWKYVQIDYEKTPTKPTLDGEPGYEGIPHGLHDTLQAKWTDADVRRYAYWSVFAGGCGVTYGDNSVMQFMRKTDKNPAYGAKVPWTIALNDPGSYQMQYLKKLILSKPYFERMPDQSLIASEQGEKYNYVVATRGVDYAFIYTYNGRNFSVNMGRIKGDKLKALWYNPKNGQTIPLGVYDISGVREFDPPGDEVDGNDWVLVLESN